MTATSNLLEIRDLSVSYSVSALQARVVEDASLNIRAGEIVGLVGESGCGKSTVAKTVLGVLPPQAIIRGEILIGARDVLSLEEKEARVVRTRELAYIPQDPAASLNPLFSVGEQIADLLKWRGKQTHLLDFALGGRLTKSSQSTKDACHVAVEVLGRLGIPSPRDLLNKYPFELSGGMKQRVLIAMALAVKPSLIIADEPGSALDVTTQSRILDILREQSKGRNLSILLITHSLGVARQICERMYVMYAGQIAETSVTNNLISSPKHPYTIALLNSVPKLTGGGFVGVPGMIPDYFNPPSGCRFHPRCEYAMDVCRATRPLSSRFDDDHVSYCHLHTKKG